MVDAGDAGETPLAGDPPAAATEPLEAERRRAVATLLQVSQRMAQQAVEATDLAKLKSECGGMSAWVSAFTCQLAGIPLALAPLPEGDLVLVGLETVAHSDKDVDGHGSLPGTGIDFWSDTNASVGAARAIVLVGLANALARAAAKGGPRESEADERHRRAELELARRTYEAVKAYELDLGIEPGSESTPEISAHGMGPEDE